ncbi:MAG: ribonuclease P protein component [Bacteroidales bacterium]|jgi:ribonuclease P protein component|nr:ribonuclease P protein component [Bacteroidales bacterium]
MKQYGFSKQERLCKRDDFQTVLTKGKSVYSFPFRCVYLWEESPDFSARIAISVSRKRFKHAVDRNRVKRLVRESYRLNKHTLYHRFAGEHKKLNMLIVYTDTGLFSFSSTQKKFVALIKKLMESETEI